MSNYPFPFTRQQFFSNNGTPLAGGLVYTYAAGTTTPQVTYNASGSVNANPITLDFRGQADLWGPSSTGYKVLVTDSEGNTIPGYPVDNLIIGPTSSGTFVAVGSGFAGTAPTFTCYWVMVGPMVTVSMQPNSGTSNATTFTLTSIPLIVTPPTLTQWFAVPAAQNNSSVVTNAQLEITANSTTWSLAYDTNFGAWTGSGTKGLGVGDFQTFTYLLI